MNGGPLTASWQSPVKRGCYCCSNTFTAVLSTLTGDLNVADAALDTALSSADLLHTSTLATARDTYADSAGEAVRKRRADLAQSEADYVAAVSTPAQTYIQNVAAAQRDHRIALATAQRNKDVGQA